MFFVGSTGKIGVGVNAFTTGNPFWGQNYLDLV